MAKALCELQLELQNQPSVPPVAETETDPKSTTSHKEHFCPETPAKKESTKIRKPRKIRKLLFKEESSRITELESDITAKDLVDNCIHLSEKSTLSSSISLDREENSICEQSNCYELSNVKCEAYSDSAKQLPRSLGNFPSPEEIASLDEKYLAKRCNLGYRAGRILKLAQSIVEGTIHLRDLEDLCSETDSSSYYELDQKLKVINGFGPFTRGNVLMCMGFYNVIPTDSETIRHLKQVPFFVWEIFVFLLLPYLKKISLHEKDLLIQVHGIRATPRTVQKVVEEIYGSFEPFQFLAYW